MKKSDIVDLFKFLSCCYPMVFKDMGDDRLERMVNAWYEVFRDERFSNLGQCLMESARRHVMGERGRCFPTPRDLIEQMLA